MTYLFHHSGEYFGFTAKGGLFSATGEYLGWLDDDELVWRKDGTFAGRLVADAYVVRDMGGTEPAPHRSVKAPVGVTVPVAPPNRPPEGFGPLMLDGLAILGPDALAGPSGNVPE